ncbi:sulfurtransferase [Janibacter sp. G56]|uniref:sulfurtransferase n=1 Tax=Janibacter sp. G56 TaxID=3418717 RepID=UPI003D084D86
MTALVSTAPVTTALITADALAAELAGGARLVVLDVQYNLRGPAGRGLFEQAHVPGAHFIDLDTELAGPVAADGRGGRHPLPRPDVLEAALRRAGVDDASRIVTYDQGTSLSAARAWWVLRWAGLQDVRVLDGGLAAWTRAGHTATTEPTPETAGTVTLRPHALPVLDADGIAHRPATAVLIDGRAPERFRGETEPIDRVAGHIPGAVNVPMDTLLRPDGRMRPPAALRAVFEAAGVVPGENRIVATSCGSGVTAAHTALALHEIGVAAHVYVGSWSDWISDPTRPMATGS